MIRRPPSSTRPDTLLPYTTRFRSRTRCERIIITPIPGVASAFPFRKGQHLNAAARRKPSLALRQQAIEQAVVPVLGQIDDAGARIDCRSEEHPSELQSLMRTSSAVFCLKKKKQLPTCTTHTEQNK